ncbi:MAG: aminomethyltransferase family protein, partial [Acidobacteriota bacterium]
MPQPTPFHSRTSALCQSHEWRDWAGWLAASTYEHSHEREYYAIRNAAALIDVSPLFKYEVRGPDAVRLVNRVMTRDISKCRLGRVMYTPWCDDDGKMIEDGTVARLADDHLRVTAAERSLRWFEDCGYGLDAKVEEVTEELAALAVQGPNSRALLQELMPQAGLEGLGYFRLTQGKINGFEVTVTRTGYTGDLGYELWTPAQNASRLWDILMERGSGYGATPTGIVALDIARIEAGLLL